MEYFLVLVGIAVVAIVFAAIVMAVRSAPTIISDVDRVKVDATSVENAVSEAADKIKTDLSAKK